MISEGFDKRMIKNGNDSRKHDDKQIKRFEELHVDLSINTFLYKVSRPNLSVCHNPYDGQRTQYFQLSSPLVTSTKLLCYNTDGPTHVHTRPYIELEILTYCIQLLR